MQIARYPPICVRAARPPRCSGITINHIGGIMCPPSPPLALKVFGPEEAAEGWF
jgi:hypothetical protein